MIIYLFQISFILLNQPVELDIRYYEITSKKCIKSPVEEIESFDTIYAKCIINEETVSVEQISQNKNIYTEILIPKINTEGYCTRNLNYVRFTYDKKENTIYGNWESLQHLISQGILYSFNLVQREPKNKNLDNEMDRIINGSSHYYIEEFEERIKIQHKHTKITSAFNISSETIYNIQSISKNEIKKSLEKYLSIYFF